MLYDIGKGWKIPLNNLEDFVGKCWVKEIKFVIDGCSVV